MAADPTRIPDPNVRALARQIADLTREVETLKRGQRATQLGSSSIEDGTLWFNEAGVKRVSIGKQVDGKFGWGAVNGDPPPRPTPAILEASPAGVTVGWDGQFVGNAPSDFTHVKAYLSPVGSGFIPSDGNVVGHLLGNAKLPVTPLDPQAQYWAVLIAYNTSGVASEPSIVAGPVSPAAVVATEILDGIVTELALADGAVSRAKLAAGAVGTAQLGDQVVDLSKLADGSVDATKIVDGSITAAKVTFTAQDIGSIVTYYQPSAPTGTIPAGSLWADSDDQNKLYRYSGSGWVAVNDQGVAAALAAAQQAQTDAADALDTAAGAEAALDGKVTVYYQPSSPSGANTGDLWLDTDDGNRLYRWSGSTWVEITDSRVQQALVNAQTAQSTADGKIQAFYQGAAPTAGMGVGDLWYNTSSGNLPSRWNGTAWVPLPAGSGALADNAVTTTKIAGNAIVQGHITADAVGANQLAANSVIAGKIAADSVTSTNIVAGGVQTANLAADAVAAGKIAADAVTARELQALSVISDKIAANAVQAGHIQAGAVTADKLEALLVLASQVYAGDPADWHLELGDAQTPILYWNNAETGFAVSRDQVTGQANVYMSGRVEFGNGSQIEQDYLDLCEQASTGWQEPKPRQVRHWIDSGPTSSVTARWQSATQPGSLCLMAVFQTAGSGSSPPNCGTPAGASIVYSWVSGPDRMTLFQVPGSTASRTAETFGSSAGAARWAIVLAEYSGIAASALDVYAFNSGTGTSASTGTTSTPAQANELHFAAFGSRSIGFTNGKGGQWNSPTNSFTKLIEGDGAAGMGIAAFTKNATGAVATSTTVTPNKSVPWMGIVATFRCAPADGVPAKPPASTLRTFTLRRAGKSTPHIIDDSGTIYPFGRRPYCKVRLSAGFVPAGGTDNGFLLNAETDLWAQGDWAVPSGWDPYGMVALSTSSGTYTNITVPVAGIWSVNFKTVAQPSASTEHVIACFVTKNTRDSATSVARAAEQFHRYGSGDVTPVKASEYVNLAAGDVLYWGNWASLNCYVFNGRVNTFTEVSVYYWGPA